MDLNFMPCLAWVPRGAAKSAPDRLKLSSEELKNIIEDTKTEADECLESDVEDDDMEVDLNLNNIEEDADDKDFEARYNMDNYDEDGADEPIFKMNCLTVYADNKDDEFVTIQDEDDEGETEEQEDFTIKETDNMLVAGHIEDDASVLDIYVYNKEDGSFYVHHDIVLPAYPLALEWLDFDPSEKTTGNFVAVGDMTPVIKIWDLDVVDILEPEYKLGMSKKKSKKNVSNLSKSHMDSVLCLSWNKITRNCLASGSADSCIILWDLSKANVMNKFTYHNTKVQALQWHPVESHLLLSGCFDGSVKMCDCRDFRSLNEPKSWQVDGEIEKVLWNKFQPFEFFCSTDQGFVYKMDTRKNDPIHSFKAHKDSVISLDMSTQIPDVLLTASDDNRVAIWDLTSEPKLVKIQKLKMDSLYTAVTAPDLPFTIAVGGKGGTNLKVIDVMKDRDCGQFLEKGLREETSTIKVELKEEPKSENTEGNDNGDQKISVAAESIDDRAVISKKHKKHKYRKVVTKIKNEPAEIKLEADDRSSEPTHSKQKKHAKQKKIIKTEEQSHLTKNEPAEIKLEADERSSEPTHSKQKKHAKQKKLKQEQSHSKVKTENEL